MVEPLLFLSGGRRHVRGQAQLHRLRRLISTHPDVPDDIFVVCIVLVKEACQNVIAQIEALYAPFIAWSMGMGPENLMFTRYSMTIIWRLSLGLHMFRLTTRRQSDKLFRCKIHEDEFNE